MKLQKQKIFITLLLASLLGHLPFYFNLHCRKYYWFGVNNENGNGMGVESGFNYVKLVSIEIRLRELGYYDKA